jgi:hypothetical protein
MGRKGMCISYWYETLRERHRYEDQDVCGWIIIGWILVRRNGMMWNGLVWLRIGTCGGLM